MIKSRGGAASKNIGATISRTVKNLLARQVSEDGKGLAGATVNKLYSKNLDLLAKYLGVSQAYLPRKIDAGVWNASELDDLSEFFDMWPGTFVSGPEKKKTE